VRRVVYENEPFEASDEERREMTALLGPRIVWNGSMLRIVGVCGHLNLRDGSCLVIRSRKASDTSILAWIAYGDASLSAIHLLQKLSKTAGDEGFGHLVARIFCQETLRVIQQTGLLRIYHRQPIRSAVVRGRIDFSTLAREGGNFAKTPCLVFSRLPETPLNRLLSTATALIHRDVELRTASGPALSCLQTLLADVKPHRCTRSL
jgi:5-methylcytosine-specific restriction endonuclease McrBC regulatory subunit McrC